MPIKTIARGHILPVAGCLFCFLPFLQSLKTEAAEKATDTRPAELLREKQTFYQNKLGLKRPYKILKVMRKAAVIVDVQ
jgi:hypothetical protein